MKNFIRYLLLFIANGILFLLFLNNSLVAGDLSSFDYYSFDNEDSKNDRRINRSSVNYNNKKNSSIFISDFVFRKHSDISLKWEIERFSQHFLNTGGSSCFQLLSSGNRFLPLMYNIFSYIIDLECECMLYRRDRNLLYLLCLYNREFQQGELIQFIVEDQNYYELLQGIYDSKKFSDCEKILQDEVKEVRLVLDTYLEDTKMMVTRQSSMDFTTNYDILPNVVLAWG